MAYTHLEIDCVQSSKRAGAPCGDVFRVERNEHSTILVVSDGLGSGIKANLAATLCVSRLLELLRRGYTLREAFGQVVRTMNEARGRELPYAVFTVMQFRSNGETTILSYEMPAPVYICRQTASVLPQQTFVRDQAVIGESNCFVEPGEAVVVVSDGVTQAGMGTGLPLGWTIEGVASDVRDMLSGGATFREIPRLVHQEARRLWKDIAGDDCTVAIAACRRGEVVNVFTGPPLNPSRDKLVAHEFTSSEGAKVVCGASTAKVVASYLGKPVQVAQDAASLIAPPHYEIAGVDLVTEGAVTLNQVYNILDEDAANYSEDSGVTRLCDLLKSADRINFTVGQAQNVANGDISYRQQGIMPRASIVPLLVDKLRKNGKLVVVDHV